MVALQHTQSLQLADVDYVSWILNTVQQIQNHTDRCIILRPHPRCSIPKALLFSGLKIQQPIKMVNSYDSFDIGYNCHAVVNLNSGPGIQAAIAGIKPVVAHSSLAAPVSINLNGIEQPNYV